MQFSKTTIDDTLAVSQKIQARAEKVQKADPSKEWTHRTLSMYPDLDDFLKRNGYLSPEQSKVIAVGCEMNDETCPDEVLAQAELAGFEPGKAWKKKASPLEPAEADTGRAAEIMAAIKTTRVPSECKITRKQFDQLVAGLASISQAEARDHADEIWQALAG